MTHRTAGAVTKNKEHFPPHLKGFGVHVDVTVTRNLGPVSCWARSVPRAFAESAREFLELAEASAAMGVVLDDDGRELQWDAEAIQIGGRRMVVARVGFDLCVDWGTTAFELLWQCSAPDHFVVTLFNRDGCTTVQDRVHSRRLGGYLDTLARAVNLDQDADEGQGSLQDNAVA